jgi:hypothetical protein
VLLLVSLVSSMLQSAMRIFKRGVVCSRGD